MNYLEQMSEMTGFIPKTDIWNNFIKVEPKGYKAVEDLIRTEMEVIKGKDLKEKENYERLTEFVMLLNWRGWYHSEKGDVEMCNVYIKKWEKFHSWSCNHLKGEGLSYYLHTTD